MPVKQPVELQTRRKNALEVALRGSEDATFVLILLHLHAEQMLDELISVTLKRSKRLLEEGRLSFKQKLLLADAVGKVDPKVIAFLNVLNKLRNQAAHANGYRPVEADVIALVGTTGLDLSRFGKEIPIDQLLPFGVQLVFGRFGAIIDAIRAEADGSIAEWQVSA